MGRQSDSKADDPFDAPDYKLRYEAYSRLQAAAVAFGDACSLPIPEIVAIGGQSDGKSSLLEAFLGVRSPGSPDTVQTLVPLAQPDQVPMRLLQFRFNVREVEMGTRRPLIVQMVHDPTAESPRCRLQAEDSEEYGPPITPETAVSEAIMQQTQAHLQQLGNAAVSAKPIVMRAEYAYCPNLTIIDTPGFILQARNGEANSTPDDILKMVKEQAAPPHRLILFLQQSSVEWASSLWLKVVQEVDPTFQRTVVVASKFDNRLKEFAERWELDRYLSATGYLPPNVKPFFVALPKDRAVQSSGEWRKAMQDVDRQIFDHMRQQIKGGFDEERFGSRIGFANLKRFLEEELARRYREAAPATLALLQERCEALAKELLAADARLKERTDVAALRAAGMRYAAAMASYVQAVLNGSTDPDPAQHGMTTEQERVASLATQWPGVPGPIKPANGGLKLFGGAAFERCLNEFQEAAVALKFPQAAVARDRIANVLLAYKGRSGVGGSARAAEDIARSTAKELLRPLLHTACARLAFVMRRTLDIAADCAVHAAPGRDTLQPYVGFHAALRSACITYVNKLEERARGLLQHHLDAATGEFALSLMAAMPQGAWGLPPPAPTSGSRGDRGADAENQAPADAVEEGLQMSLPVRTPFQLTQMTVPETPSPERGVLQQQQLNRGGGAAAGPGRHVSDTTPSKGRVAKAQRLDAGGQAAAAAAAGAAPLYDGRGTYSDVLQYAERLFCCIRTAVAVQAAPTSLKSAFLDPIAEDLATQVSLELFARSDKDYMSMFTAAGALAALQQRRDQLHRSLEGLLKCKTEFAELARCL